MPDPEPGTARGPLGAGGLVLLLGLLLGLAGLALWVPSPWLEQVTARERTWYRQALGERSAAAVLDVAQHWSETSWDQNDDSLGAPAMRAVLETVVGMEGIGSVWVDGRLDALRRLVELACLRAALLRAWAPALGLLLVAGVLEGHWRWRIRQLGFDYPSPVARQASQAGLALMVTLVLVLLFAPLPLHPFVIPLLTLIATRLIGAAITHLPKQL